MNSVQLAEVSNYTIAGASVVYVLAFLCHVGEWALSRTVPVAAPQPEPVMVPSGVSADPAQNGPEGPAGPPDVVARSQEEGPPGSPERMYRADAAGRIGISLTVLACGLHLVGVVTRGLGADPMRMPWGNIYEFCITGGLGMSVIYLVLLRRYHLRWLSVVVTGFLVALMMVSGLVLYVPVSPLVPALQSYWLVIHVSAAIIATSAFAVGALTSVLFLLKRRDEQSAAPAVRGYLAQLPVSTVIDRISYRVHAFAFPIWTFAVLIAGPIWAQNAWGSYWSWDPKEVWAFITWVVYAAYLHARATAGWRGKRAAIVALVGFGTLLFNSIGINLFGTGMHTYALM